ncbi:MAG: HAD-IA family hydrolase [Candidatus Omnitrophota bacterium]|nr:HAD-IA family hydrolase [Candidatus Omnitrophota bacterium]MDZ4241352.1 HAD-IA family hydrolase [Candidatus Omnitrophota bacterium]
MNRQPVFIFDFDGTIADTHHYIVQISNRLAAEFKYKPILPHEVELLKDKTSQEVIRHLNVPVLKIPAILARAKKEFYAGIGTLKPIQGLKETIHRLKREGVRMGILSSNAAENVKKFLSNHALTDSFEFIDTTSKVWSKNTSFKKLIARRGFTIEQLLYIGDETRDIVAAQALGIHVAAVTWGYNSMRTLRDHNPDYIIHTPQDLYELCTRTAHSAQMGEEFLFPNPLQFDLGDNFIPGIS